MTPEWNGNLIFVKRKLHICWTEPTGNFVWIPVGCRKLKKKTRLKNNQRKMIAWWKFPGQNCAKGDGITRKQASSRKYINVIARFLPSRCISSRKTFLFKFSTSLCAYLQLEIDSFNICWIILHHRAVERRRKKKKDKKQKCTTISISEEESLSYSRA